MENRHIKARSKQRIPNENYRRNYSVVFKKCDCDEKCKNSENCKCKEESEGD